MCFIGLIQVLTSSLLFSGTANLKSRAQTPVCCLFILLRWSHYEKVSVFQGPGQYIYCVTQVLPSIDFCFQNSWFQNTGGPHYMRSFYLQIHVYAIEKWPFFWNLSSNLQWSFVFLYVNSWYSSIFLESLSLAYNEGRL